MMINVHQMINAKVALSKEGAVPTKELLDLHRALVFFLSLSSIGPVIIVIIVTAMIIIITIIIISSKMKDDFALNWVPSHILREEIQKSAE